MNEKRITFTVTEYGLYRKAYYDKDDNCLIDVFSTYEEAEIICKAYEQVGDTNLIIKPIYKYKYTCTSKEWDGILKFAKIQV